MPNTCFTLLYNLSKSVDKVNDELVYNMMNPNMKYEVVCVKPNVTYDHFFQRLKEEWEGQINEFIQRPDKCSSSMSNLLFMYNLIKSENINPNEVFGEISKLKDMRYDTLPELTPERKEKLFDLAANVLMTSSGPTNFVLKENITETLTSLGKILFENCSCQIMEIFAMLMEKYSAKYKIKFQGKKKEEIVKILKQDFEYFKSLFSSFNPQSYNMNLIDGISTKFTGLFSFSVESELDKLIPNELGSLKTFFVKVLAKYYNNLHPIIWAQIYKQMVENIFIDLPLTQDEIFRFVSKYLLLNSGPFILKMLQTIRPVLSPELATKYNLTKLEYPKLKLAQVNSILSRVVYNWDMYKVLKHFSASVGHVCKVIRADNPTFVIMIKIIKPLAIAQSCWEYKTLYDVYEKGSCEQQFIKNILESNGRELNVLNEKLNIERGHKYYSATYNDIYGVDINANFSTIDVVPNVIAPNTWYALAMTLAPGIPLSVLVESDLLKLDTPYRAKLHRCLDLLVNKFFYNIIKNKYYHGDLHAGNVFFSFESSMLTLIDFGAVGEIDLFEDDNTIHTLLDIVIMSIFYNYEGIFDTMTKLLNSKCPETQIDMNSSEYIKLKDELKKYHLENIRNSKAEEKKQKEYEENIFGKTRISQEKSSPNVPEEIRDKYEKIKSIYEYLEMSPKSDEAVVMNEEKDVLPAFNEILGDNESKTFPQILEIIIKYYALSGVNIAIKFNELYEFQKAYALLLGVLHKTGYNSYRTGIAINKAILTWSNIPALLNISTMKHVISSYWREHKKYDKMTGANGTAGDENANGHVKYVFSRENASNTKYKFAKNNKMNGGASYKISKYNYKYANTLDAEKKKTYLEKIAYYQNVSF